MGRTAQKPRRLALSRFCGLLADAARVGRAGASKAPADMAKACGLASGYAKSRVRRYRAPIDVETGVMSAWLAEITPNPASARASWIVLSLGISA